MDEPCWLVADLGGTNLRLALTQPGAVGRPALRQVTAMRALDFKSFDAAARAYLDTQGERVQGAVISVAGRVVDQRVVMTNLAWTLDARQIAAALQLAQVHLINDLAAVAAAVPVFDAIDAPPLWQGGERAAGTAPRQRCVVVGAGTGLGMAGVSLGGAETRVIDTEGGHAAFAPETELEEIVGRHLRERHGRVSWERVVSGPGLMNVHAALAHLDGASVASPEELLAAARAGQDARSDAAVRVFAGALAAVLGDAVLMHGAWDGAWLVGGLPQAVRPWLDTPECRARFLGKGSFAEAMRAVPARLVQHHQPGLLGAAQFARAEAQALRGGAALALAA